jgi:hypothetical protein
MLLDVGTVLYIDIGLMCVGFALTTSISFGIAHVIFKSLRKFEGHLSQRTYRMHMQLTILLIAQVRLEGG